MWLQSRADAMVKRGAIAIYLGLFLWNISFFDGYLKDD